MYNLLLVPYGGNVEFIRFYYGYQEPYTANSRGALSVPLNKDFDNFFHTFLIEERSFSDSFRFFHERDVRLRVVCKQA